MSAQPKPFPPKPPTVRELQARIDVYAAEIAVLHQAAPALLLAALRRIVIEADAGCRDSGNPQRDAERLAALFSIRHVALDALSAVRVSERGPTGKDEPCAPQI